MLRGWQCEGGRVKEWLECKEEKITWILIGCQLGNRDFGLVLWLGMTYDQKDYCDNPSPDSDFPTLEFRFDFLELRTWIETWTTEKERKKWLPYLWTWMQA